MNRFGIRSNNIQPKHEIISPFEYLCFSNKKIINIIGPIKTNKPIQTYLVQFLVTKKSNQNAKRSNGSKQNIIFRKLYSLIKFYWGVVTL